MTPALRLSETDTLTLRPPEPPPEGEPLTEAEAEAHIASVSVHAGPTRRCGVELEWLVHDRYDAFRAVEAGAMIAATSTVRDGRLSIEPGGQLEYSSSVADDLNTCVEATANDMAYLRAEATRAGVHLVGIGVDPYRDPHRILRLPRYTAMEQFFDRDGCSGRWMMCSTASVQVCLDAGKTGSGLSGFQYRWRLAHALGPVLVASFANSPIARFHPTGWASTRQAIWARMDNSRTRPVIEDNPLTTESDQIERWARYALDANVLCIRRQDDEPWTAPAGLTFRSWIRASGSRPTKEDLNYHLSTLFPPIRPHGYLELRMIDAQRGDGWIVPLAVCSALLDDPTAAERAMAAVEPLWDSSLPGGPWRRAAQAGLADPTIATAATACFSAAIDALPPGRAKTAVEAFAKRYVLCSRSPADDLLYGYREATTQLIEDVPE